MKQVLLFTASIFFSGAVLAGGGGIDTEYDPLLDAANLEADTFFLNKNVNVGRVTVGISGDYGAVGIAVDRATETVYLNVNGQSRSFGLTEIAAARYGSSTEAGTAFVSKVRAYLGTGSGLATYQFGSPSWVDRGGRIDQIGGPYLDACSFAPCLPHWSNGYGSNYSNFFVPPGNGPEYGNFSPEVIEFDRRNFEEAQRRSCESANVNAGRVAATVGGTLGACGLAETGFGLVGCMLGLGALVEDVAERINGDLCGRAYPGPGKWKE